MYETDILLYNPMIIYLTYFLSAVAFALLLAYIVTKVNETTHQEEVKYFNSTLVPLPFTPFVGREAECNDIMMLLEYESSPITAVSLVAPFGYGKSELAKEIGNKIALNETSVQFIDLFKVNDTILFDDTIIWHLALATGNNPFDNIQLPVLAKRMTSNTLLILDNCDAMFSSAENDLHFQEFLEYTIQLFSPLLKLLTTSRRTAPFLNANFEVYFLSSLSTDSAIEFLVQLGVPADDVEMLASITEEVENVPYSLRAIGAKLKLQLLIDPEVMYYQLRRQNLIDILAPHLKHKAESSIYMTYRQITPSRDCRKWSYWFITNAPSGSIPMWSNNLFCLNELLEHSMIIPYQESNETLYIVPRIVREFYQHTLGKSPIYIAMRPDVPLDSLLDSDDSTMLA